MTLKFLILFGLPFYLVSLAASQSQNQQPLSSSTQMIVVTTPDWNAVSGQLQRYERARAGTQWKPLGSPVVIVVGKTGLAWGSGLFPTNSDAIRTSQEPVKKEGDGKSPAGVFLFGSAFGYADRPLQGSKLPYIPLTPKVECVDDAASHFYNRILDRTSVSPDWNSSEKMASAGEAYRWGAVIDHNSDAIPNAGSCVFMHIWAGPGQGTAGCTAMPQDQLEPILAWLDPAAKPILVQLPVAQYKKLKTPWHLPELSKR
jgi:D-alanyl-D-alanine dipeptidase